MSGTRQKGLPRLGALHPWRAVRSFLRNERGSGSDALESGLTMGLIVVGAIFVIAWVSEKIHDKLADFDSATHVVAHEVNYKVKPKK